MILKWTIERVKSHGLGGRVVHATRPFHPSKFDGMDRLNRLIVPHILKLETNVLD
jgi:hypothetical protein